MWSDWRLRQVSGFSGCEGRFETRRKLGLLALVAAIASGVGAGGSPSVAGAGWAATYAGQCCYTTLEAGQLSPPQWFDARNTGTLPWSATTSPVTHLGTAAPHDRASALSGSAGWISPNRAASIEPATVGVGQTGRFAFRVRAPGTPGTYTEHFAPVADGAGGGWMDGQVGWGNVFLRYTVKATQPPTIDSLNVSPRLVDPGSKLAIAVKASDNVALHHISMSVGDASTSALTPYVPPYTSAGEFATTGELSTAGLGEGGHTVVVRAVDQLGQATVGTQAILVGSRGSGAVGGEPGSGGKAGEKDKRTPRARLRKFLVWFNYRSRSATGLRFVHRIKLAPAPKGARGMVFCRRGCRLPARWQRARRGQVLFRGGALRKGVVVRRGARIESRLLKGRFGRFKVFDSQLSLKHEGCLKRVGKAIRRHRCGNRKK